MIFSGQTIIHGKGKIGVTLGGSQHPTMPSNSYSLVRLGSRRLDGRILLSLQFEFLALRGHMSTIRIARGHIIKATCQATCPFGCLDAHAYSLYRDPFWIAFLILYFKCCSSVTLPLCFFITTSDIIIAIVFQHRSRQFSSRLVPLFVLSLCCSAAFGFHICVAMFQVALPQGLVLLCLIMNVVGYYYEFIQMSSVEIIPQAFSGKHFLYDVWTVLDSLSNKFQGWLWLVWVGLIFCSGQAKPFYQPLSPANYQVKRLC